MDFQIGANLSKTEIFRSAFVRKKASELLCFSLPWSSHHVATLHSQQPVYKLRQWAVKDVQPDRDYLHISLAGRILSVLSERIWMLMWWKLQMPKAALFSTPTRPPLGFWKRWDASKTEEQTSSGPSYTCTPAGEAQLTVGLPTEQDRRGVESCWVMCDRAVRVLRVELNENG
jgi:hypothetical protein